MIKLRNIFSMFFFKFIIIILLLLCCTLRSRVHPILMIIRTFFRDWRTMIHFNVVLKVFHIYYISQGVCKNVRTTFQCIVVLQLWGEGPEKAHKYGMDFGQIFWTFSLQLENNDTLICSSDSLAHN